MSVDTGTGTPELLREVLGMAGPDANRIASSMPEVDRFRLGSALRYLRRAKTPFDVFFFVESLVAAKQDQKCRRVTNFFRAHASLDDKIELAAGWAFTDPFHFGSPPTPPVVRHVMHSDCFADATWVRDNAATQDQMGCFAGPHSTCVCVEWLRQKPGEVDRVLGTVIGHLCDMRHSLVHESWPVLMVSEYAVGVASPTYSSVMLDIYPCDRADPVIFRTYETGMSFDRFKEISTAAARNHLIAA